MEWVLLEKEKVKKLIGCWNAMDGSSGGQSNQGSGSATGRDHYVPQDDKGAECDLSCAGPRESDFG